jgi:hypothetical protein
MFWANLSATGKLKRGRAISTESEQDSSNLPIRLDKTGAN